MLSRHFSIIFKPLNVTITKIIFELAIFVHEGCGASGPEGFSDGCLKTKAEKLIIIMKEREFSHARKSFHLFKKEKNRILLIHRYLTEASGINLPAQFDEEPKNLSTGFSRSPNISENTW